MRRGHRLFRLDKGKHLTGLDRLRLTLLMLCMAFLPAFAINLPADAASLPATVPAGSPAPVTGSPSLPVVPPEAKPPGEREPLIGFLAAASIVVAAVAGVYVYRVIRKGL